MNIVKKISDASHTLASIILGLMFVLIVIQIIFRLFEETIIGVEELTGYWAVWATYLAIPFVLREGKHVKVDFVTSRLSSKWQDRLNITGNIITAAFCLIIFWKSISLILLSYNIGRITPLLQVPVYILQVVLPVGILLLAMESIFEILRLLSKSPKRNLDQA